MNYLKNTRHTILFFLAALSTQSQCSAPGNLFFLDSDTPGMAGAHLDIRKYYDFIIHPCDPTVVICYLIWPCDIAVCITYLISHSSSLTYNSRIFQFGCMINTKLPSCDDIIRRTSLGFPSWCPESTRPTDSCFQAPAVKTS